MITLHYHNEDTGRTVTVTSEEGDVLPGHNGVLASVKDFLRGIGFFVDRVNVECDSELAGLIVHSSDDE